MTTKKTTTRKAAVKRKAEANPVLASKDGIEKSVTPSTQEVGYPILTPTPNLDVNIGAPVAASVGREKYYEAVGGRKESIARVRLYTKKATDLPVPDHADGQTGASSEEKALITVNGKDYRDYFTDASLWGVVESPLRKLKSINRFKATVVVHGGGKSGQAGAIKHGIARTLVDFDQNFRKKLKKSGYLTRDPRAKERRKYGLKKARKAPRWAKR
jgi:small subunit ribosomal protein S9